MEQMIFCNQCGAQLEADAMFCPECGARVVREEGSSGEQQAPSSEPVQTGSEPVADPVPMPADDASGAASAEDTWAPKWKLPLLIATAAILGILALFLVVTLIRGMLNRNVGLSEDQLVYLRNGTVYYMDNIAAKSPEAIEILDMDNIELTYPALVGFPGDGSYLYYFSKLTANGTKGNLCRVPVSKLKSGEDKLDRYVEEIDSKLSSSALYGDSGIYVMKNNHLLYIRDDDRLYYYNGKDSEEIDKGVTGFTVSEDEKGLYYFKENKKDDAKIDIYYATLKKLTEADKVETGVDVIYYGSGDLCIFGKEAGKDTYDLFYTENGKEPVDIEEDVLTVNNIDYENKKFYFTKGNSVKANLYDLVYDPLAEDEDGMQEPSLKSFLQEIPIDDALDDSKRQYITRNYNGRTADYIKDRYYIDSQIGMYGFYSENLGDYAFYDDNTQRFYKIDRDAYQQAQENWSKAVRRVRLREELKKEDFKLETKDLYVYDNGKSEKISENILAPQYYDGFIMYLRADDENLHDLVNIENINGVNSMKSSLAYSFSQIASEDGEHVSFYRIGEGEEQKITYENEWGYLRLSEDKKTAFRKYHDEEEDADILMAYKVTGGALEEDAEISNDCYSYQIDGNAVYYTEDYDNGEGDLYCWKNGKAETIAKNVGRVYIFDDNAVFALSDGEYDKDVEQNVWELYSYNSKGEKERIASDTYSFSYASGKRILYVKDENLYLYKGSGDPVRIARGVDHYWYPAAKAPEVTTP
ncbi:MAG: zinc ribbon domain-containing protein [Lachnospiraceae bacterium]|nr:zinc ribbon domain-containing protein [Lachnospiraceae bacterium]